MYTVRDYDADDYEGLTNLMKNGNMPLGWNVDVPSLETNPDVEIYSEYCNYGIEEYYPQNQE